ncbi:MAG: hypothetical protein WCI19_12195 [Betaproteobacteria bacterium]|nr:hypothetical protein [Rhodocyclales bacterium]
MIKIDQYIPRRRQADRNIYRRVDDEGLAILRDGNGGNRFAAERRPAGQSQQAEQGRERQAPQQICAVLNDFTHGTLTPATKSPAIPSLTPPVHILREYRPGQAAILPGRHFMAGKGRQQALKQIVAIRR